MTKFVSVEQPAQQPERRRGKYAPRKLDPNIDGLSVLELVGVLVASLAVIAFVSLMSGCVTTEFDLLDRQTAMAAELHIALPIMHGPSTRMELIRREIEKRGIADHRVRQSRSETWAQAFERVHGEPLE